MKPYYQDEWTTIYNADCRDVLPQLDKVDLVLTDPPYGIGAAREKPHNGWRDYGINDWDLERPDKYTFDLIRKVSVNQIIWGGNYFTDYLPPTMQWLVWDKRQRNFSLADCEIAWSSSWKASRIYDYSRAKALQDVKQHPTQKPVSLMVWCLELFPDAKTIVDPYLGSGTTALAAKLENRHCIGIEISEKYCDIAVERLRQSVMILN